MQSIEKSYLNYSKRTLDMKKKVISQKKEMCIERAVLITESYKKTKGENPIIRFAKAINYLLTNMTIKIWDDEYIIGNRTTKYVGTPLYPEIRVDSIEQDYDTYDTRPVQPLFLTDDEKRVIKEEIIPYWKNEEQTVQERFYSYLDSELKTKMETLVFVVDAEMTNGMGHFLPGHKNILKYGINGLIQKAEVQMSYFSNINAEDTRKSTFLQSVIIVYHGVKAFIQRFAKLSNEMAEKEPNLERKKELFEISEICQNISENPPNSFKEALQLIYFTHLICGLEDGGFAISIGRLDQLLYSYYVKDISEGIISTQEVQFLIECFFIKLTTLWNYMLSKGVIASEGPPITENLTIGGIDRNGNDATNKLSYLILDSYTNLKTVQPTFSIRIHENTSEDFLTKVSESIKSGTSISLLNDDVIIKGLKNRGFTLEDAREYAPIGCVEPQHPHKSLGSTNSNQLNVVKCLELALTNGIDIISRKQNSFINKKKITSFDDLWNAFIDNMKYFIKYMVLCMSKLDRAVAELSPQPFLSATIDDCIDRGLDITNGGAIYNFTGPQLIGLATVADSLAVIKKLIFEEKVLTLEDLIQMLKKNFKGTYQEKNGKIWREIFINKVPKFGNDDDYVDLIAANVVKIYCDEISSYTNYRGGRFNPGVYSTTLHLGFGIFTGASADGRLRGEPLSNGVGPTNGRDKNGPTAILNSVKKLPNELMTNGTSLIIAFHPNTLSLDKFPAFIRSFFEPDGGFQIQFNVIGKKTLYDAQKNPDEYLGLVVRIAGYSVLFTELSKIAQNEIIARTEYSL